MEMNNVVREVLHNNYRRRNLIGHYHFWVISPRNSTSFTRPFLAGRHTRAGHETKSDSQSVRQTNRQIDRQTHTVLEAVVGSVEVGIYDGVPPFGAYV